MALLTLLSWNIQILGPAKIGLDFEPDPMSGWSPYLEPASPAQKAALLLTIGETIVDVGADIVSVLEVCNSTAYRFRKLFLEQVKKATAQVWDVELVPSNKNDVYFIAYRKDAGFDVLRDSTGAVIKGTTHQDVDDDDLNFSSSSVGRGGRWPGYVAFETDAGRIFTVICYHACMGGNNQKNGIINIADVAPVTRIVVDGTDTAVPVSVVSGDFNVDYLLYPKAYANVTDAGEGWAATPAVPSTNGDSARTSLKLTNPNIDDSTSLTFRNHAYDNIFAHGSQFSGSDVQDMIQAFVNPDTGPGQTSLQKCARRFDTKALNMRLMTKPNIGTIGTRPPKNVTDTWRIYRRAVSDHLPVWATFNV
jgi:endonuclease/exonuclease/phosphatase family metal-dependent hydrolase